MDTLTLYEFIPPIFQALREGGDSLTQGEMVEAVARILQLPDVVMERRHTRYPLVRDFDYCLAWAQAFLKQSGYLTRSVQGVWVLTPKGKTIDAREVLPDFDTEGILVKTHSPQWKRERDVVETDSWGRLRLSRSGDRVSFDGKAGED